MKGTIYMQVTLYALQQSGVKLDELLKGFIQKQIENNIIYFIKYE